jgi:hypothetical protein
MSEPQKVPARLVEKIESLPAEAIADLEIFVDYLWSRDGERDQTARRPLRPTLLPRLIHPGHLIHLSLGVHRNGSSPRVLLALRTPAPSSGFSHFLVRAMPPRHIMGSSHSAEGHRELPMPFSRLRTRRVFLPFVLVALCAACPAPPARLMVQPLVLRWTPGGLEPAAAAAQASVPGKPDANRSYLSLVFESAFLRDFGPAWPAAAVGVLVHGAVRGEVATVLRLVDSPRGGGLSQRTLGQVGWFPYRGEPPRIYVRMRALGGDEVSNARGRLVGAAPATAVLDPLSEESRDLGRTLYESIVAATPHVKKPFLEVSLPLVPDSVVPDKADLRLPPGAM